MNGQTAVAEVSIPARKVEPAVSGTLEVCQLDLVLVKVHQRTTIRENTLRMDVT